MSSRWAAAPMAAAITITVTASFAVATGSCRSTSMSPAARRPRRRCSTESSSCSGRSAAKGRLSDDWLALMPVQLASHVPRMAPNDGVVDAAKKALAAALIEVREAVGEIILVVRCDSIVEFWRALRDTPVLEYEQLMDIGGYDY